MPKKIRPIRILMVLECLAKALTPLSLSQLAQETQIPRSTLSRLVEQLTENGFVIRLPAKDNYVLGPRALQFGFSMINTPPFLLQCQSILKKLANQIGETCNLTYINQDQVQYLVRVENNKILRLQLHLPVGTTVPLHCTASGKILLAHLSSYDRKKITENLQLDSYTERTILDLGKLNIELDKAKREQIGIDNEEFIKGMIALAVPIFDQGSGRCIAALACHAPVAHTRLADLHLYIPSLRKAATQVAELLIYD